MTLQRRDVWSSEVKVKRAAQRRDVWSTEVKVKRAAQRRDVWSTEVKVKRAAQRRDVVTSRRFHDSCIRIIKSTGDPIFEVSSDVRTRSGTRSKSDPRDRENSCLCVSLLKLLMIYRTTLVITFIMF